MSTEARSIAQPAPKMSAPSARTRFLLEGPIASTLLRLAAPNVIVNVVLIAVTATVDAHFVGRMGSEALAGLSLVFPLIMLMQQMANSSMGGAIASAIARAIGAGRHADASALVVHGIIIAAGMAAIFASILLIGGPVIYGLMSGTGDTLAAALEYSNAIFAGALAYWLLSTLTSVVRGAGEATVLAVQIQSGGEGIDLTRAAYCAYYSIGHSLGDYDQSLARIHRPGQTRPVVYYHLTASATVDVAVYDALDKKRNVIDAVLASLR